MNGWLEKKSSGFIARWQRRYFRLDAFNLFYFETDDNLESKDVIDTRDIKRVGMGDPNKDANAKAAPDCLCVTCCVGVWSPACNGWA